MSNRGQSYRTARAPIVPARRKVYSAGQPRPQANWMPRGKPRSRSISLTGRPVACVNSTASCLNSLANVRRLLVILPSRFHCSGFSTTPQDGGGSISCDVQRHDTLQRCLHLINRLRSVSRYERERVDCRLPVPWLASKHKLFVRRPPDCFTVSNTDQPRYASLAEYYWPFHDS